MKRLRGVVHLVRDAVVHGSAAVEQVQKEAASLPFRMLESIPAVAAPARLVHTLHDVAVSGVHGLVRQVTRGLGATADVALDVLEQRAAAREREP